MGGGRDADDGTANDTPVGEKWISQSHIEFRLTSKDVESADKKKTVVPIHAGTLGKGLEHWILKQAGLI